MLHPIRSLGVAVSFSVSAMAFTACSTQPMPNSAPGTPAAPGQSSQTAELKQVQDECDAFRVRSRRQLIRKWQLEKVASQARLVSKEFSADEIEDIKKLAPVAIEWQESYAREDRTRTAEFEAAQVLKDIYNGAVARAGITLGAGQKLDGDLSLYTFISPSTHFSLYPGSFEMVSISTKDWPQSAKIGQISSVALLATADQKSYFVALVETTKVSKDGSSVEGQYISLLNYVNKQIPAYCAEAKTTVDEARFNSLAGI